VTHIELYELLRQLGYYGATIDSDPTIHSVRIVTKSAISKDHQETIRASTPAGVTVYFVIGGNAVVPIPKGLEKWFASTSKYIKED
jgi:hypothetical protein